MKKKILVTMVLIILMASLLFLTGCANKENYNGEIVSFEYGYGGFPSGYWDYKIYTEDSKTYILASGMNGVDLNLDKEIDNSVLEDLTKIVKENKIYKWDGFSKINNWISDGYGFELLIKYDDGKEIKAYGHEKYPANYEAGHEALSNYLESIEL